jgi:hypothetical protein
MRDHFTQFAGGLRSRLRHSEISRERNDNACLPKRPPDPDSLVCWIFRSCGVCHGASCVLGYLKLSLVSCPIALFPATSEREKISFHQLNKNTGHRIKYRKVDAESGDEV